MSVAEDRLVRPELLCLIWVLVSFQGRLGYRKPSEGLSVWWQIVESVYFVPPAVIKDTKQQGRARCDNSFGTLLPLGLPYRYLRSTVLPPRMHGPHAVCPIYLKSSPFVTPSHRTNQNMVTIPRLVSPTKRLPSAPS